MTHRGKEGDKKSVAEKMRMIWNRIYCMKGVYDGKNPVGNVSALANTVKGRTGDFRATSGLHCKDAKFFFSVSQFTAGA